MPVNFFLSITQSPFSKLSVYRNQGMRLIRAEPRSTTRAVNLTQIGLKLEDSFAVVALNSSGGFVIFRLFHQLIDHSFSLLQIKTFSVVLKMVESTQSRAMSIEEMVEILKKNFKVILHKISDNNHCITVYPTALPDIPQRNLVIMHKLSSGAQAEVYEGFEYSAGVAQPVALKKFQNITDWTTFQMEYDLLSNIPRHTNVVQVRGIIHDKKCVLLDFISGVDLKKRLERKDLPGNVRGFILLGIALGLQHIHQSSVCHRDLKSENIMIEDNTFRPVIVDFGLGKLNKQAFEESLRTKIWRGTACWMAPEMFSDLKWGRTTDVYAFGVVMWEVLTEQSPYSNDSFTLFSLANHVKAGGRPDINQVPLNFQKFVPLMVKCWGKLSADRPSIDEVVLELESLSH